MRKLLLTSMLLVALAAAALPSAANAALKRVRVGDVFFAPASITIRSGDSVRWRWVGVLRHNVTVTRGPRRFHSRTKTSGRYTKTLTARGTYRYICTVHPVDMRGRVTVE
jgi:plastocyanin